MRVLVVATLMIAAISASSSARAQAYNPNYPVCLKVIENFGSERVVCAYTSLAQCNQTALGLAAQCVINPFYGGAAASSQWRRRGY